MEIIKNFGIDPRLFVAQIVNFLIILYILKRFAYKPLMALLRNREETIKEGLKNAEKAQKMLEEAQEKEKKLLQKAQSEAQKLLADAKEEREEMIKKAEMYAKKQTDSMLREAKEQIAEESRMLEKKLSLHVTQLAVEFLQKSLSDMLPEKEQVRIMDEAVKRLKKKTN